LDALGTLEPGKLADVVMVEADPLIDIQNARRVRRVLKAGRVSDAATSREQKTCALA
jgi:imidazolonepropionase-like amidohydrolase